MKFRIIELLLVTAVCAFAIACLNRADYRAQVLFENFALLVLLSAIPMAIGRIRGARAFWVGFVTTGMLYVGLSLIPDIEGNSPRLVSNEFTTILACEAFYLLDESNEDELGDPFSSSNNQSNLSLVMGAGQRVLDDEASDDQPDGLSFGESETSRETDGDTVVLGGGFGGGRPDGMGGPIREASFDKLIDLIKSTVDADSWEDTASGFGTIQPYPANITCMVARSSTRIFECFVGIAHSAWALFLGWIIGHVSRFVFERTRLAKAKS